MSDGATRKQTPIASERQLSALQTLDRYREPREHVLRGSVLAEIVRQHRGELIRRRCLFAFRGVLYVHPQLLDEFLFELGTAEAEQQQRAEQRRQRQQQQLDESLAREIAARLEASDVSARDGFTLEHLMSLLQRGELHRGRAVTVAAGRALKALGYTRQRSSHADVRGVRPWIYRRPASAGQVINFEVRR